MKTIRINDKSAQAKAFIEYIKTLSYVQIDEIPAKKEKTKKISKDKFLKDFKQSCMDVKAMSEGKMKKRTLAESLKDE